MLENGSGWQSRTRSPYLLGRGKGRRCAKRRPEELRGRRGGGAESGPRNRDRHTLGHQGHDPYGRDPNDGNRPHGRHYLGCPVPRSGDLNGSVVKNEEPLGAKLADIRNPIRQCPNGVPGRPSRE